MRAVLTKVKHASVTIDGELKGKIGRGFLILLGVAPDVSQFTLYGNCRKGRRPEFLSAARPEIAIPMYEKFVAICREKGYHVETGEFGAYMEVESLNDGPFTLIVDSADLDAPKKQ